MGRCGHLPHILRNVRAIGNGSSERAVGRNFAQTQHLHRRGDAAVVRSRTFVQRVLTRGL